MGLIIRPRLISYITYAEILASFIDEVQDFTELEVFLMGMTVKAEYNQITLSGDQCQQLQSNGTKSYGHLFPFPRAQHNRSIFLDRNFRQRDQLSALSAGFRRALQEDERINLRQIDAAALYTFTSKPTMAGLIFKRIRSVNPYATVALIVPTADEAKEWFDMLNDDLATGHRPALLSRRDDLTRRVDIHFTDVYETKGLEFDVVIVPNLGSFALDTDIGRNQAYVAVSRAKYALLLGCNEEQLRRPEICTLVEHKLLRPNRILVH